MEIIINKLKVIIILERRISMTKKTIVKEIVNKPLSKKQEGEILDLLTKGTKTIDIDKEEAKKLTFKEKLADYITAHVGSWSFIICFASFLLLWIILNLTILKFDPFPFILLNLFLSCLSALQAPIIMMSQNRASQKEVKRSQNDYKTNLKSELILEEIHQSLEKLIANQKQILKNQNKKQ